MIPTIFNDDGSLDSDRQRRCIEFMVDAGSDGPRILANFTEQFVLSGVEPGPKTCAAPGPQTGSGPIRVKAHTEALTASMGVDQDCVEVRDG